MQKYFEPNKTYHYSASHNLMRTFDNFKSDKKSNPIRYEIERGGGKIDHGSLHLRVPIGGWAEISDTPISNEKLSKRIA